MMQENFMKWTAKTPNTPGRYWFYGDPYFRSMGCHHSDRAKDEVLTAYEKPPKLK